MEVLQEAIEPILIEYNSTIKISDCPTENSKLPKAKKVNRSYSTIILPILEVPGELEKNQNALQITNHLKKRSRSLSPCVERCNCYNCNVSQLIHQDLNPSELLNLKEYFNTSPSMILKMFNESKSNRRRSWHNLQPHILTNVSNCCLWTRRMSSTSLVSDSTKSADHFLHADNFYNSSLYSSYSECSNSNVIAWKHSHIDNYNLLMQEKHYPTKVSYNKTINQIYLSKIQPKRSFSSPDTRPTIIEPYPTCTARRHRHSISGQMSYFKLLGYNVSKKLAGSTNSLFSTAVISGSSSAPNLKDMIPSHASAVAAIEGFGGVPPIRPLETLHNALSLRQLDSFLDMMTSAPLFRTPASSPPKFPSPGACHPDSLVSSLGIPVANFHPVDLESSRFVNATLQIESEHRNPSSPTSPNSICWGSEAQSFLSSEPSSPAPTSGGESSMSISLISNDGQVFTSGPILSTPCLEMNFNEFCVAMDQDSRESGRGSISYTDYYSNEDGIIRKPLMGEQTPKETMEEDEEHTLTLRRSEEQIKQDVQSIFESQSPIIKPGSSFKKIGRFRVESMDIADEDVRIKEGSLSVSTSMEKLKTSSLKRTEESKKRFNLTGRMKKSRGILRSQSVSNSQADDDTTIDESHHYSSTTKLGSFSNMMGDDLETWKQSVTKDSALNVRSNVCEKETPVLTVANTLKDSSNITIGFDVDEKQNELLPKEHLH